MVIGVVLLGFQHNAFADEKDKDKKTDQSTVTRTDTIKIKVNLRHSMQTTLLVFDDFDEDGDDDKGDNSSIALTQNIKTFSCNLPSQTAIDIQEKSIDPQIVHDRARRRNRWLFEAEPFAMTSRVYPNPATADEQSIFVEHNLSGHTHITVYSMSGQVAFNTETDSKRVKIDSLTSGIYIVNISGVGNSDSKKLLVQ